MSKTVDQLTYDDLTPSDWAVLGALRSAPCTPVSYSYLCSLVGSDPHVKPHGPTGGSRPYRSVYRIRKVLANTRTGVVIRVRPYGSVAGGGWMFVPTPRQSRPYAPQDAALRSLLDQVNLGE